MTEKQSDRSVETLADDDFSRNAITMKTRTEHRNMTRRTIDVSEATDPMSVVVVLEQHRKTHEDGGES